MESGESSLVHVRGRKRNDVLADQVVRCDPNCQPLSIAFHSPEAASLALNQVCVFYVKIGSFFLYFFRPQGVTQTS
jgi:hypothetical protein